MMFKDTFNETSELFFDAGKQILKPGLKGFLRVFLGEENISVDWHGFFEYLGVDNIKYYDLKKEKDSLVYIHKFNYKCKIEKVLQNKETLAKFLKTEVENISLELKKESIYITKYKQLELDYTYNPQKEVLNSFKVLIGYMNHKKRYFDILEPSNSHIFIGASTRGGKSNLMRLILTQLIQKPRKDIELSIINPKVVDFIEFENTKNVVHYTEETNEKDVLKILNENIELMNNRYNLFKRVGVKNLIEYRKKIEHIPLRIIVIDELATYQDYTEFHKVLTQLSNKGVGAGIILMLSSQILNKDIMTNQVRQNLNTVFGGRCKDSIKSNMIMENSELHKIKKVGQFKIFDIDSKENGDLTQTLYIENEVVKEICNKNIKKPLKAKAIKDLK